MSLINVQVQIIMHRCSMQLFPLAIKFCCYTLQHWLQYTPCSIIYSLYKYRNFLCTTTVLLCSGLGGALCMKYIYTYVYTQCQYLCQKQMRRGGGRTIAQYMSYNSSQPCYVKYKFGSMSREDTAGNVCNTHLTAAAASSAQVWPLFLSFSRPSGSCGSALCAPYRPHWRRV